MIPISLQTLFLKLDILRLPTDELILRFFSDLVQLQSHEFEGEKKLGTFHISVCYIKEESVVEVKDIQGKGLPGLGRSGML